MSASNSPQAGSTVPSPPLAGAARRFLVRLTIISTLGGLLFGYDTGVIAGALLTMPEDLGLTTFETATVVTVLLLPGAALGALLAGRVADRIGRRRTLLVCGIIFLVGALSCSLVPGFGVLVVARFVLGLGVGAAAVICPVYLAEMAPRNARARMVTINELMIVTGQLLAFAINAIIGATVSHGGEWRIMLGVAAVPAVGLLVGMLVLPESPRWLALRDRVEEARAVLARSRSDAEVDAELAEVAYLAGQDGKAARTPVLQVLRANPWMRRLLWIGGGLAAVQQATGINTVNYYGTDILAESGLGDQAALVSTIAIGATSVTMTVLGIWLLGFVGRRKMLLTGFIGVAGSQAVLATVFLLPQSTARSYVILGAMIVFVAFVQCFIGTGIWLMLAEIFPLAIRGFAMGLAVFVLWTVNGAISFAFPPAAAALGSTVTFLLFAAVNVVSIIFILRFAPETKGHSLESLEEHLRTSRAPDAHRQPRLSDDAEDQRRPHAPAAVGAPPRSAPRGLDRWWRAPPGGGRGRRPPARAGPRRAARPPRAPRRRPGREGPGSPTSGARWTGRPGRCRRSRRPRRGPARRRRRGSGRRAGPRPRSRWRRRRRSPAGRRPAGGGRRPRPPPRRRPPRPRGPPGCARAAAATKPARRSAAMAPDPPLTWATARWPRSARWPTARAVPAASSVRTTSSPGTRRPTTTAGGEGADLGQLGPVQLRAEEQQRLAPRVQQHLHRGPLAAPRGHRMQQHLVAGVLGGVLQDLGELGVEGVAHREGHPEQAGAAGRQPAGGAVGRGSPGRPRPGAPARRRRRRGPVPRAAPGRRWRPRPRRGRRRRRGWAGAAAVRSCSPLLGHGRPASRPLTMGRSRGHASERV